MATEIKERTYIMTIVYGERYALHAPDCEHADAIAQAVVDRVVTVQEITTSALKTLEGVAGAPQIDKQASCLLAEQE